MRSRCVGCAVLGGDGARLKQKVSPGSPGKFGWFRISSTQQNDFFCVCLLLISLLCVSLTRTLATCHLIFDDEVCRLASYAADNMNQTRVVATSASEVFRYIFIIARPRFDPPSVL